MSDGAFQIADPYIVANHSVLNNVILRLRSHRPILKNDLYYTTYSSGHTLFLWIQTPPCRFSIIGKCSVCDYWSGSYNPRTIKEACSFISSNTDGFDTLLLNTCGSVLDEQELPFDDLLKILDAILPTPIKRVILETHLAFCTKDKLLKIAKRLSGKELYIEYGQESANPDVLKYCLNKAAETVGNVPSDVFSSLGINLLANVLLGAPFLNVRERIYDSTVCIRKMLAAGNVGVVLFPVNVKRYTLVEYLYRNGYYKRVSALEIVEVLRQFSAEELERIDLAWFEPRKQNNTAYNTDIISPLYCEKCGKTVLELLRNYNSCVSGEERLNFIRTITNIKCKCHDVLYEYSFPDIRACYEFIQQTGGRIDEKD